MCLIRGISDRGIRSVPGLSEFGDQIKLFAILHPEGIGVTLADTLQIEPDQSTSAIIVHHQSAKYFVV